MVMSNSLQQVKCSSKQVHMLLVAGMYAVWYKYKQHDIELAHPTQGFAIANTQYLGCCNSCNCSAVAHDAGINASFSEYRSRYVL